MVENRFNKTTLLSAYKICVEYVNAYNVIPSPTYLMSQAYGINNYFDAYIYIRAFVSQCAEEDEGSFFVNHKSGTPITIA